MRVLSLVYLVGESTFAPVITGLATGIVFVVIFSSMLGGLPLHPSDYVRIGKGNVLVKTFLQNFPEAHVSVVEYAINETGAKGALVLCDSNPVE